MQNAKGFFITIEGVDGAGKTTQSKLLHEYLNGEGYQALLTREPGGTLTGERVRAILLDPACDMGERTETFLYLAVRAEHVDKIVQPALLEDKIVISDRFSDSTFVYQGIARGLGIEKMVALNEFATNGLVPDLTILLDAPVEKLKKRVDSRAEADRIEKEGLAFQGLVRDGFLKLAASFPERIIVIDALLDAKEIQAKIRSKSMAEIIARKTQARGGTDK